MSKLYNSGLGAIVDGSVTWATATIKAIVVDSTYTFDDNDQFVTDITGEVTNATGTGYSRKTLTGKTVTVDQANDRVVFDASDVTYTEVETNETWDAVVLFQESGADATSKLICFIEIDDLVTNGSDASIVWASTGIFRLNNT